MTGFDERRRVASHFALCHDASTALPFTVGGVTQHGWHADSRNNQDAMGLWIEQGVIVAVVCDGCASPASASKNSVSLNEVGAKLTCLAALRVVREQIRKGTPLDESLSLAVVEGVRRMVRQVVGIGLHRSEPRALREKILLEYVMSTLLLAVVTAENYLVFAVGDGFIRVNDTNHDLSQMSGHYLANEWFPAAERRKSAVEVSSMEPEAAAPPRWLQMGSTAELHSLVLASDGAADLFSSQNNLLGELQKCSATREYLSGYDPLFFREFRVLASRLPVGPRNQDTDDQTLVAIRRLPPSESHDLAEKELQGNTATGIPSTRNVGLSPAVEPIQPPERVPNVEDLPSSEALRTDEPFAAVEPIPTNERVPNVEDLSAIETVPTDEPSSTVEPVPHVESVLSVETVTTAAPVPSCETIPAVEPVSRVESIPNDEPGVNAELMKPPEVEEDKPTEREEPDADTVG